MKIGITGAAGFLGSDLVGKLQQKGHSLKVFVKEGNHRFPKDVEVTHGDLVSGKGLDKFLSNVETVIHLAARVTAPEEKMFEDNVIATYNLVVELLKFPVKHLVFTSTVAVYGKDRKGKFKEKDECFPNTEYGLTKFLAEKEVQYWSTRSDIPVTILRPFNIYGPDNYKGIIYSFLSDIKNKGHAVIYGNGKQKRDFLYIDDFIEALLRVIDTKKAGIFNLGAPDKYSILEILEMFRRIMKKDIKAEFNTKEKGKVFNINQDLSLVKKELNWEAKTSLEDGLRKTIKWYEDREK